MPDTFKSLVRKKAISWPTERNYSQQQWDDAWESTREFSPSDSGLYKAGLVFDHILSEIRQALASLYAKAPKTTREQLIIGHCAISNRDRCLIGRESMNLEKGTENALALSTTNNEFGLELNLQEVAEGCVDAHEKALKFIIDAKSDPTPSDNPMGLVDFVVSESKLSQAYQSYESYWSALVWGDYSFLTVNEERQIYEVRQQPTETEIAFHLSQTRKFKLAAQAVSISAMEEISKHFKNDKYVYIKGAGKKKSIRVAHINKADKEIQTINSDIQTRILFLEDNLPKTLLNTKYNGKEFTVIDAMQVFRLLTVLSQLQINNYPLNDALSNEKKLFQFSPTIKKSELIRAISKCTDLEYQIVKSIIEFLIYRGGENEDLWCEPLMEIDQNKFIVLTSALITPVLDRVAEHWLVKLRVDLQDKGPHFEKETLIHIKEAISNSTIISDFSPPVTTTLHGDERNEEIDILFRIGKTIIIGEAKSIVTCDSPLSFYRTHKTLTGAAEQANRKATFFRKNIADSFKQLGWKYDDKACYKVFPMVINSNKIHSGFPIFNTPVCDEKILTRYFERNTIPLLSSIDNNKTNDYAWFKMYEDAEELERNLCRYLLRPPQIYRSEDFFDIKSLPIPAVNDNSYKIIYSRIINKDYSARDVIRQEHAFPVETCDNIDEVLASFDITM